MELLTQFIVILFSATIIENAVFNRALGSGKDLMMVRTVPRIVAYGTIFMVVITLSCTVAYFLNYLLREYAQAYYTTALRNIVLLLAIFIVYTAVYLGAHKLGGKYFEQYKGIIPITASNCAVYGATMIIANNNFGFVEALAYAIGTGFGVILAYIVVYIGRKHMELCILPRAFKGIPIILLYIGLVSLAMYGLVGHSLPT